MMNVENVMEQALVNVQMVVKKEHHIVIVAAKKVKKIVWENVMEM